MGKPERERNRGRKRERDRERKGEIIAADNFPRHPYCSIMLAYIFRKLFPRHETKKLRLIV